MTMFEQLLLLVASANLAGVGRVIWMLSAHHERIRVLERKLSTLEKR